MKQDFSPRVESLAEQHDRPERPIFLSVIIPAYNEANRIARTLDLTVSFLQAQPYASELIIVDDGSQDQTGQIVEETIRNIPFARLISYHPNAGKGKAVRTGIVASRGQYVLFMDADFSTPITELEQGLAWIQNGYDIAIGSRALPGSNIQAHQPRYREISAQIFKWIYRTLVGVKGVEDTQCGFKLFKGDVARSLFARQRIDGYMFDIETLYFAQRLGIPVKEFPVAWKNDPDSRLRIIYDTMRMFKHLFAIRLRKID